MPVQPSNAFRQGRKRKLHVRDSIAVLEEKGRSQGLNEKKLASIMQLKANLNSKDQPQTAAEAESKARVLRAIAHRRGQYAEHYPVAIESKIQQQAQQAKLRTR